MTKETGETIAWADYDAWGVPLSPRGHDMNMAGMDNVIGFTSYTYDKVLDLYFAQARFYDQNDRRFISVDPIKDGVNWYAYCGNSPTVFVDPSGLKIVVFNYNRPGSGFDDQVQNSPYFDADSSTVEIKNLTTTQEFVDAWNGMDDSDIDSIYLYLHGGEGVLYFADGAIGVTGKNSINELEGKNVNGKVYLFSCKGGKGAEGNNVAWGFASITGATVRATNQSVSYTKILGSYHARVDKQNFFHPFNGFWGDYSYGKQFGFCGEVVAKVNTHRSKWAV